MIHTEKCHCNKITPTKNDHWSFLYSNLDSTHSYLLYLSYMQYQLPQFIDIEDKIVGPLTFKQFIYIAGGAGICFIAYRLLPFWVAVIVIPPQRHLVQPLHSIKSTANLSCLRLKPGSILCYRANSMYGNNAKPEKKLK